MNIPPVAALEIGTTRIRVVTGEAREDGVVMITGLGEVPSRGVRKGDVVDFELAVESVRSALEDAEKRSQVSIHEVHLLLSGGDIQGLINRGTTPVQEPSGEITLDDMDHCLETARAINLPHDRQLIHTIPQRYLIDDHQEVLTPAGMEGAKLSVDMLLLHGVRGRLRNTVKVVRTVPTEVEDVAFSGLCGALAVLSPEQKEKGVVLLDLGGGTTDFVVYARGAIAWAGTMAVGGDHITNDVARGLRVSTAQAERLKEGFGSALVDLSARGKKVAVPAELGVPDRHVFLNDLNTIIHLRVEEILQLVKQALVKEDLLHLLGTGVVMVGGVSHLRDVDVLARKVLGLPSQVGRPRNFSGWTSLTEQPEYAAALGMVRYGLSNMVRDGRFRRRGGLIGFFRR
jgi:cell division protein FtsA